jgi:hypothetical protein
MQSRQDCFSRFAVQTSLWHFCFCWRCMTSSELLAHLVNFLDIISVVTDTDQSVSEWVRRSRDGNDRVLFLDLYSVARLITSLYSVHESVLLVARVQSLPSEWKSLKKIWTNFNPKVVDADVLVKANFVFGSSAWTSSSEEDVSFFFLLFWVLISTKGFSFSLQNHA